MARNQIRIAGFSAASLILLSTTFTQSAMAEPFEMPNRKPRLWEIKVDLGAQMPAMVVQQCTDATTDKDMATSFSPMAKEMCANQNIQKTATGMVVDATCTVNGMTSVSHTEINGDFNSSYTVKVSSKNTGAPAGVPAESVTVMEAKWPELVPLIKKPAT